MADVEGRANCHSEGRSTLMWWTDGIKYVLKQTNKQMTFRHIWPVFTQNTDEKQEKCYMLGSVAGLGRSRTKSSREQKNGLPFSLS